MQSMVSALLAMPVRANGHFIGVNTMSTKATNTKASTTSAKPVKQPQSGLAAIATQVANAVTATANAGTLARRPAVAYTNGSVTTATGQMVALQGALATFTGNLPATNPANSGKVGNVKVAGQLALGNGKGPRAGHNLTMWQAIQAALPCTSQQAAEVCGSAAFVQYAVKNGWLAVSK
jgi:hypothetical protein